MADVFEQAGNPLRVMVVGPGRDTEGGITTVISRIIVHLEGHEGIEPYWVVTHKSAGRLQKAWVALKGTVKALSLMPKIDLVHIHSAAYFSFMRKSAIFWLAKIWRKPVIWHLHTPNTDFCDFFGARNLAGRYARSISRRVDRVVVLSDSWRSIVAPYFDPDRVRVILNPIPGIDSADAESALPDSRRILYLAHLIQRKGYPLLIKAFGEIAARVPDCKLVFAGSGEVEQAQAMCRELGIEDKVEFLGWIGDAERSAQLQRAGIFVLPSYQEGLPMGVLEAMAFGLAVVTTPVGGIGDVVVDGKNGLLVAPGEEGELAEALSTLVDNPAECQRLGDQARQDVRAFAPADICADWVSLYRELWDERSRIPAHDSDY